MMTIITWTIIVLSVFIAVIFTNILAGWVHFKYFRKCPRCHSKMQYQYKIVDKEGSIEGYIFYCPHCQNFEVVSPIEMLREEYDIK